MNSDSESPSDDKKLGVAGGIESKNSAAVEGSDDGWEEFQFGEDKSGAAESAKPSAKVED